MGQIDLSLLFGGFNEEDPDSYCKFASPGEVAELDQLSSASNAFIRHLPESNRCSCSWCKVLLLLLQVDCYEAKAKQTKAEATEDEIAPEPQDCNGKDFVNFWVRFKTLKLKAEERGWDGVRLP